MTGKGGDNQTGQTVGRYWMTDEGREALAKAKGKVPDQVPDDDDPIWKDWWDG